MIRFSKSNLQEKIVSPEDRSFDEVNMMYNKVLQLIKDNLELDDRFSDCIDSHMKEINSYLTKTYLRSDILKHRCK